LTPVLNCVRPSDGEGEGAASGGMLLAGGDVARTIQTTELNLNHRDWPQAGRGWTTV